MRALGALFVSLLSVLPAQIAAQGQYPFNATIRGENIWVRVDPAEDTEIVAYLQRGDRVRVMGDATAADGDAFYPVRLVETGETGWVRDLAIDPTSIPTASNPEVVVDNAPETQGNNRGNEAPAGNRLSESEFQDQMAEQAFAVSDSFAAMSDLLAAPDPENPEWRQQMEDIIAGWRRAERMVAATSPPPAYSEAHAAFLRGLGHYNSAGETISALLETGDTTLVDEILQELELGGNEVDDAIALLAQMDQG